MGWEMEFKTFEELIEWAKLEYGSGFKNLSLMTKDKHTYPKY